jgi:hypothetical protein
MLKIATGAAREDELRARMVILDEKQPKELFAEDIPCESHSTPNFKSKDSMKHSITITLPELVWTVDVELDEDIEGMVVTTFSTNSSTALLSYEVSSCSVADLKSMIINNLKLTLIEVEDWCGTLEAQIGFRFDREETETERRVREILCRLFKIEI